MTGTMIVRLAGNRGQYAVREGSTALLQELNELDNQIVGLLERSQIELARLLGQMTERVRAEGEPVETVLLESDLILPPDDLTLFEAAQLFTGEGLLPG